MTVKELIEKLQTMNPDLTVTIYTNEFGDLDVTEVYQSHRLDGEEKVIPLEEVVAIV